MRKKTIDMIPVLSDDIKTVFPAVSKILSFLASLVKQSKIILFSSQSMPKG